MHASEPKPTILYFGNDWFAENRTSSHQIARRLAKTHRVYYIECPGLRAPQGSGRDFKKILVKLARFLRGAQPVAPNLKVRTLLQIPLHRFAVVRGLNRALIGWTLRWLLWREAVTRPVTWFMVPHLASIVGTLGERLSVYYCIDDYSALPGVDETAVRAMDMELTRRAGLVFVASETLLADKLRLNPETRVSPHGVDLAHFVRAMDDDLHVPDDASCLPGPVVGFFGLIERWIDLDLVDFLAHRRPNWSFLLIGRVAIPDELLPKRSNVFMIGKRPYEDLPAYGKRFDAAIIPYRLTRQVLHANPIKLREYLAMGKPVVSVSTPEIDKYADVVTVARNPEQFLAGLDAALAHGLDLAAAQRRVERVASESWDARVEEVLEIVRRRSSDQTTTTKPVGLKRP